MSINKPPAASRVQFVRKSTAATIPARFETAGYVVGPDGTLHKAKARVGSGRRLGPGTYDVTHFGSTSERFRDDKPRAPAPGTYTDPRTAITVRQTSGLSGLPFQQTAPRFEEPHIIRETPAPIEYSVSMPAASKGATSAFHSTARRTEPMFKRDTFMTPSPFDYQREEDTTGATFKSGEKQNYHAAFGVRARRFGDSECDIHVPPPTKYDVSGEQKHRPEGVPKSQPHPAFRSRTKRTQLPVTNTDTPPPNSYNPSPPKKQGGGRLADHERERFRVRVSDAPPPTSYSPHPAVADSMYKRSFNATIEHNA
ncbi:hypothetical protein PTSG_04914 [Salpingoeca rosetta]|uniref:Uncharacterized protein n=1 Tax=Salpingoeca rosetta (strain ATCC 50818 / BSB-021) TaxID=946362 RepID=F2U8Z7_SALR5|nr:uncharacterized protein PTSG_04914 [Salpingoeca rosetta]EGD73200.1 hypothetical protein PTSG_04914 [Salpingoeca rosetta]|eukprot:XP_004994231.1 hypothetical protein PTSG_04914 [Salpingoeca rosetta]